MRTYSVEIVEKVTGIKLGLIQQWENRGLYVCELRREAEFNLRLVVSHDKPERREGARQTLENLKSGWKRFTFVDILRLTLIRKLTAMGVTVKTAAKIALEIDIYDEKTERELEEAERRRDEDHPDLHYWSPETQEVWGKRTRDRKKLGAELAKTESSIVFNLTAIRRNVISRLDESLEK